MYRNWMESVQKIGEICKSGVPEKDRPEQIMKTCGEISQQFADQWLSFVSDQSRSFMTLREACSPAQGEKDCAKG